jgi:hypothetical protein
MNWTLRRTSFDCFQQTHGPRPIDYEDWFYSKLYQFVSILLYDKILVWGLGEEQKTAEPWKEGELSGQGPIVDLDELEQSVAPEDRASFGLNDSVACFGLGISSAIGGGRVLTKFTGIVCGWLLVGARTLHGIHTGSQTTARQ